MNSRDGLKLRDEYIGIREGENNPVPIKKFTHWPRLRTLCKDFGYGSNNVQGKAVIMEALKKSATVNIVDEKTVQRKDNIDSDDDDGAWDVNDNQALYVAPLVYRPVRPMVSGTPQSLLRHC